MKKYSMLFLITLLLVSIFSLNTFARNDDIKVMVDGSSVSFDQPPLSVDDRILVPIRAVCEKIGSTVSWDRKTNKIIVIKGDITLSLKIGSRVMEVNDGTNVYLDVAPKVYKERTLLPIRAVVEKLGCEVQWDQENKTVRIEHAGIVMVNNLANTNRSMASRNSAISSVQQFSYKDEGLAYAYIKDKHLEITLPSKQLSIEMKYPILGDVLSDGNGDIYIVWGKSNETNDAKVETVFISKYSSQGKHVKTTGFVGASSPWGDSDGAKTKLPFYASNSVSVIEDGILINYHGKRRYDGHQSDSAVAVKTSDMSAYKLPNDTFSGHSFGQSIIYSKKTAGFIFASQGDAYSRGFRINDINGKYGRQDEVIFNFYLESNADYNMSIVNKTFAQMGNMVETSKGVALVGASAKSIGEQAKTESQNLFVQIFDPLVKNISPQKFIGGVDRSGATSYDINDNGNSPLEKVTDYGVHWLTHHTDTDVAAPQVVEMNDNLVIMWTTKDDTFYMVLSAQGNVITPATTLNGASLNSYERPIYYEGAIHWVSVKDGRLKKNILYPDNI